MRGGSVDRFVRAKVKLLTFNVEHENVADQVKIVARENVMLVRLQVVSSTAVGWQVGGQAGWQADRSGWLSWEQKRVGGGSGVREPNTTLLAHSILQY